MILFSDVDSRPDATTARSETLIQLFIFNFIFLLIILSRKKIAALKYQLANATESMERTTGLWKSSHWRMYCTARP